jgi:vitamin-K-epoxide reductase (warfarin-sensitive)
VRYLIALLAIAGIVVSTLALRVHYSNETQPCSINEHWDCGVVNHSSFAEVAHIPVAGIGIAGYALLAILALFGRKGWTLAASILGLAFALYLTYVERNILQVWCLYCVISQGIIATVFLLSLLQNLLRRNGGKTLV